VKRGAVLGLSDEDGCGWPGRTFRSSASSTPNPGDSFFSSAVGEYHGPRRARPVALHFPTPVRSGMDLSGIVWKLTAVYSPGGSYLRDSLSAIGLVDRWSMLGAPLWLFITLPSGETADGRRIRARARPVARNPAAGASRLSGQWLRQSGAAMLWPSDFVRGVIYNPLSTAHPHEFVEGGLLDTEDLAKPAFGTLAKVRRKYLPDGRHVSAHQTRDALAARSSSSAGELAYFPAGRRLVLERQRIWASRAQPS